MAFPLAILAAVGLAAGQPAVIEPSWIHQPTAAEMMAYYPPAAAKAKATGLVVLLCTVKTNGYAEGCAVESESPAEQHFGDAALKLSRLFQFHPKTIDGQAVDAAIKVPINFKVPAGGASARAFGGNIAGTLLGIAVGGVGGALAGTVVSTAASHATGR